MLQDKIKKYYLPLLFFVFLCLLAVFSKSIDVRNPYPKLVLSKEQSSINFKSEYINLLSLGHSRLISSLLWITTLLESDIEHYKGNGNSWMYHRFMSIAKIDPYFYDNYIIGGQYLSIIKDDTHGANDLYSLGIRFFPNDFWLYFHAGFNATFELKNKELGLEYYSHIIDHPNIQTYSPSLITLYRKLLFDKGELSKDEIFDQLELVLNTTTNETLIHKLKFDLYCIKTEKDLNCLNNKKSNCDYIDYFGKKYIFKEGNWYAYYDWKIYQLNKKD